jgi:hypothetical protein|tara:strand:+ start:116 stop:586 length:471 start_codon:yes stop_codon:yes gene_type:complete
MATPARKLILDNIASSLETITTGNGYKTSVDSVNRRLVSWEEIGISQMPWVGFAPIGQSTPNYKPNGFIDVRMQVTIVGHVNSLSGAAKTTALANLEDDIIAAINDDTSRGNNAIRTNWLGTQTDEGNADSDDHRGGSGTLVMMFEVLYQRTVDKT